MILSEYVGRDGIFPKRIPIHLLNSYNFKIFSLCNDTPRNMILSFLVVNVLARVFDYIRCQRAVSYIVVQWPAHDCVYVVYCNIMSPG